MTNLVSPSSTGADAVIEDKVARVQRGSSLRSIELCSGAGGMSLGFLAAGIKPLAHIEFSQEAAATYAKNFLGLTGNESDQRLKPTDMMDFDPRELLERFSITSSFESSFDVLIAGLPCQAFARVGRSKLREVAGHEEAYKLDPRASMYKRFISLIKQIKPLAVVLENVPDILNFGGHNVPEEICLELEKLGYVSSYSLLNSAFYGVPQYRERLFLVAYHKSLGISPSFPEPTNYSVIPRGYIGSRQVALKHIGEGSRYIAAADPSPELPPSVNTSDALSDLPIVLEHLDPHSPRTRLDLALPYRRISEVSQYAGLMRTWMTDGELELVTGNGIRRTPRDYETFARMQEGDDYPAAVKVAEALLGDYWAANAARNNSTEPPADVRSRFVPPYDTSKFPNKWWKMRKDAPARTLTAHMGKDTYSHIHYDSSQKRMLTVREAARLQSFPDWFDFGASLNAAFRQIGNAVPPLLAFAVANSIQRDLTETMRSVTEHS